MFKALWNDSDGTLLSAELVLVSTLVFCGVAVGVGAVRTAIVQELADLAEMVGTLNQSYSVSGVADTHHGDAHGRGHGRGRGRGHDICRGRGHDICRGRGHHRDRSGGWRSSAGCMAQAFHDTQDLCDSTVDCAQVGPNSRCISVCVVGPHSEI